MKATPNYAQGVTPNELFVDYMITNEPELTLSELASWFGEAKGISDSAARKIVSRVLRNHPEW